VFLGLEQLLGVLDRTPVGIELLQAVEHLAQLVGDGLLARLRSGQLALGLIGLGRLGFPLGRSVARLGVGRLALRLGAGLRRSSLGIARLLRGLGAVGLSLGVGLGRIRLRFARLLRGLGGLFAVGLG